MATGMEMEQGRRVTRIPFEKFQSRHDRISKLSLNMNLDEQFKIFMSNVTMTQKEKDLRMLVLDDLLWALKPSFPDIKLHPFGSLVTELGDKQSDLDVFADCFGKAIQGGHSMSKEDKTELLIKVEKILKSFEKDRRPMFFRIITIQKCRVPIVKFIHGETQMKGDISFENILSVKNTELVKFMIDLDPRVRPLMCLVRYFGKYYDLIDSGKIKSYGFSLMLIVYLCGHRILPNVYDLQHFEGAEEFRVDHWNGGYFSNKELVQKYLDRHNRPPVEMNQDNEPTTLSILKLFHGFLDCFGPYKSYEFLVCPLLGKLMPRMYFLDEESLPKEMDDYRKFSAIAKECGERLLNADPSDRASHLLIQDPFILNYNVSGVTRPRMLRRFQHACQETAAHLQTLLESGEKFDLMSVFKPLDFSHVDRETRAVELNVIAEKNHNRKRKAEASAVVENGTQKQEREVEDPTPNEPEVDNRTRNEPEVEKTTPNEMEDKDTTPNEPEVENTTPNGQSTENLSSRLSVRGRGRGTLPYRQDQHFLNTTSNEPEPSTDISNQGLPERGRGRGTLPYRQGHFYRVLGLAYSPYRP